MGAITLAGLADSAQSLGLLASVDLSYLLATVLWGMGLWAIGVSLVISWHNLRHGGIPFSLSWWAFIFPLAAYTMSSIKLAAYFDSGLIMLYTAVLTLLLAALWLLTFWGTFKGILSGALFRPQP